MKASQLADRFGLTGSARLSEPVARGKQGLVRRLETTEGSWAVKVPFEPVEEQEVAASTAFQEAAHAAGVPTPAVRRTTEGAVLADVDGHRVRLYSWVDVGPPDATLDPVLVGTAVASLHQVRGPEGSAPLDAWYCDPVGAEQWDALVSDLRREGAPFAERFAELCDDLVALEGWLEPPGTLQCCHRDLWADNLLPTVDGGVCVLDWENSGDADPHQELGVVLFEFARGDAGRARALTDAYRDAGGPARVTRRGHFSMLVAQLGHITEIGARDWLVPNHRSPTRADAEAWVRETLDDPHTPVVLDDLLVAVR